MVSWSWPTFPRFRFRFAFLEEARWRRPGLRRRILPPAVTLNRLATAFLVFRRAMDLGMGGRTVARSFRRATLFLGFAEKLSLGLAGRLSPAICVRRGFRGAP